MKKHAILSHWCNAMVILSIGLASGRGQCLPAPEGLIGLWAGDGNANDLFQDHHGTLAGNASANTAGYVNQCFRFDGTNGFISILDAPELRPANLTIEAWVRFDGLTSAVAGPPAGYQYLVFKKNTRGDSFEGFSLQKSAANAFEFVVTSAGGDFRRAASSSLIVTGAWFHVAGVRGSNFIQIYVNGALAGQTSVTAPQDYDSTPIYFGTTGLAYDARLKGSLDEVTLYSRALSAPELNAIFVAGGNGKCKSGLNDHFANRRTISGMSNTVYATSANATKESGEPEHAGDAGGHSLWWTWTAPTNGVVSIHTIGSSLDTLLAVYTGSSVTALTEVASNDQMGSASDQSRVFFPVTANTVYQIAVDGWYGESGAVVLNLQLFRAPVITAPPVPATNIVANTQIFEVAALSVYPVTYQWRKGGVPIANATNSSISLTNLRAEDSGAYSVAVQNGYGLTISASAQLTVPAAPVNDQFTNRIFFGGYSNSVAGSNVGASYGAAPDSYLYGSGDVWWAWIAPTNGAVTIDTLGSSVVLSRSIYWNTGTNLNYLDGDSFGEIAESIPFDAIAGREYVFQVGDFISGVGNIVLNLRMQLQPPRFLEQPQTTYAVVGGYSSLGVAVEGSSPLFFQWRRGGVAIPGQTNSSVYFNSTQLTNSGVYSVIVSNVYGAVISSNASLIVLATATNNMFASRILVTGNTNVSGHNLNFSKEDGEPDHADKPGGASAWWSWQAASNGIAVMDLSGSSFDTLLGVYTGNTVSNLSRIAANDDAGTNISSQVIFPCVAGTAYHVAVDGKQYAAGNIALSIQRPSVLAPQIVTQPKSLGVLIGTNAQFDVLAYGMPTNLNYRWFSNGVALNATNSSLTVSNASLGWSGTGFSVAVSNTAGVVTSLVATLTVASPSPVGFKGNWPGYWGGAANDVHVWGSYAYVATDAGLLVLDVSDPVNPYRVGSLNTDTPAVRIAYTNGFAYLITASNQIAGARVSRFDVRNAALPKKVAECQAVAPQAIATTGNYVYLADGTNVLTLNANLQLLKSDGMDGTVVELHLLDYELVVCRYASPNIGIYDITSPTNLVSLSTIESSWTTATTQGDYLYTISSGTEFFDFGVESINISDRAAPQSAGWGDIQGGLEWVSGFAVQNGQVHLFWWNHNWPETRVSVFDISNERYVTPVGSYVMPPAGLGYSQRFGISGKGNYLFVAAGASGLMILDTSDPAQPELAGQFYTAIQAEDVAIENNYAFVTDRNTGFHILDVSDPVNPVRRSTYHITNQEIHTADKIVVQGRYAYVGVSALNWVHGFETVDISDPSNPRFLGKLFLPGGDAYYAGLQVTALSVKDDLALMATHGGLGRHLYLIDVRDKARPRLVQNIADVIPGSGISGLAFRSNHVYTVEDEPFGDYSALFRTYELTSTTNLVLVAERLVPAPPNSYGGQATLSIDRQYAYVGWFDGTEIFDLTQPANPQRLTAEALPGKIALAQDARGFGSDSESGFSSYSLSNPVGPIRIGNFAGIYGATEVEGRYAFVAGDEAGLTILDLGAVFATAPVVNTQPQTIRAIPGASTNLFVGASGTIPLGYHWRFNGTSISGGNSPLLVLPNVQPEHAGAYSVMISNANGSNLSAVATLTVDQPAAVALISPGQNQYVWPGSNVLVTANAFDPDATNGWNGYVALVEFYTNSILWQTVSNVPPFSNAVFNTVFSNAVPGLRSIQARALDNEGAWSTSAVVSVSVTNLPAFQLSAENYPVLEADGVATVTVRRNLATNAASVTLFTENATAFAAPPGGIGSYYALTNFLTFPTGVLSTNVQITLVNDLVNRGDRQFVVRLANPTSGWQLVTPTNAYVTILDDDPLTNNFADVALPVAGAVGALRVTLQPTNALGKWRFWWESDWRDSASTVSNLSVGDYDLEFLARSGFIEPASTSVTISNAGAFFSYTNYYTNLISGLQVGGIAVAIQPSDVATAGNLTNRGQWRLSGGNTNWNNSSFLLTNLLEGAHLVEFKPIPGYETPPRQVMYVNANRDLTYTSTYLASFAPIANGPVPLDSYNTITNDAIQPGTPYRFAGQIISDVGLSSGFVVKPRTVLTAAHAVFDVNRLTFSTNVWWFFQRHRGEHESLAQQPRGWHVFSGYAAARTNDPSPIESSIETRNLDVAALYFFEDAGRGGYGGYLITSTNGQWLDSSLLKLMVGYPVDGVPESHRGKMHQVGPFFAAFQKLTNQVYRSDQVVSYGGHSGGPVCVLSTNSSNRAFFIPAGIYLGGSGETVVRAIDLDVVDLINRAENSSHGGTNSTGGGVIVWTATGGTGFIPGLFRVNLSPTNVIAQGAGWRVKGGTDTNWINNDELYYPLLPGPLGIEFNAVSGYRTPADLTINLTANQTTVLDVSYLAIAPSLFSAPTLLPNGNLRITLVGSSGNVYAIQTSSNLINWTDLLFLTNTTGTNFFTNAPTIGVAREFFRARQLP